MAGGVGKEDGGAAFGGLGFGFDGSCIFSALAFSHSVKRARTVGLSMEGIMEKDLEGN